MITKTFLKEMPKVELHAHLNGSLSTGTLLELGEIVYGKANGELQDLCESFKRMDQFSLSECFKKFQIAHDLTVTKDGLSRATLSVIRDFAQDHVVYLELRTTPRATANMTKTEYLQIVLNAIGSAKLLYPDICVKLLPSIDRSKGFSAARDTLDIVRALDNYSDTIKGIDLSGNPSCGTFDEYVSILNEARQRGLKLAIHCAEISKDEETKNMIEFGMERCGHGTFMSPKNLDLVKAKRIPIECCLSSNVKCGTVKSYKDHHFNNLFESDHPVMLCTDDSGVFDTTLTDEFIIAQKTFNLSKRDIQKLSLNAVDAAFANEGEKSFLRKLVNEYFAES